MKFRQFTTAFLLLSFLYTGAVTSEVGAKTLQGGVNEDELKHQEGPSLKRQDIDDDPFGAEVSTDEGPMLQPPGGSYQVDKLRPDPPKRNFNLQAQDEGGQFNGQNQAPMMEAAVPPENKTLRGEAEVPNQVNNDPDKSREMQLLWDAWHKRVAENIYQRFNSAANIAFKNSPPLACQVSYAVSYDGQIGNVKVLQKSTSPIFNAMLLGVITSMQGNPVLQFPPNSRRQMVEKSGTFTWNYGQAGYKYTMGDRETVKETIPGNRGGQPMMQQQWQNPGQGMMMRPMGR